MNLLARDNYGLYTGELVDQQERVAFEKLSCQLINGEMQVGDVWETILAPNRSLADCKVYPNKQQKVINESMEKRIEDALRASEAKYARKLSAKKLHKRINPLENRGKRPVLSKEQNRPGESKNNAKATDEEEIHINSRKFKASNWKAQVYKWDAQAEEERVVNACKREVLKKMLKEQDKETINIKTMARSKDQYCKDLEFLVSRLRKESNGWQQKFLQATASQIDSRRTKDEIKRIQENENKWKEVTENARSQTKHTKEQLREAHAKIRSLVLEVQREKANALKYQKEYERIQTETSVQIADLEKRLKRSLRELKSSQRGSIEYATNVERFKRWLVEEDMNLQPRIASLRIYRQTNPIKFEPFGI